MFPFLPRRDPGEDATKALACRLEKVRQIADPNLDIPAGYTYLGQFIDHDITFAATSAVARGSDRTPVLNLRTPRFDLDSLYGSGPADQPFLYDWGLGSHCGAKLLVGRNPQDGPSACIDLPRNTQERALIGDPRNDEHLIISQLHLLFIKFHNRVVDHLHQKDSKLTHNELFAAAHRTVRWHYQWIVMHDFLRRIVGPTTWNDLLPRVVGGPPPGDDPRACDPPAIPVEFSAAAYRFGHSMVRFDYDLRGTGSTTHILPAPDQHDGRHLGGFRRLPAEFEIEWRRFFGPRAKVHSMLIDHRLTTRLHHLPPDNASLVRLNLERGRALKLPSGPDVARAMGHEKLSPDQLFPPQFWPDKEKDEVHRRAILDAPPLWFYLLREAATYQDPAPVPPGNSPDRRGRCLGPVGGRIVGETLIGLLEADPSSYLHQQPPFEPTLPGADGLPWNEMHDLVQFTLDGEEGHDGR